MFNIIKDSKNIFIFQLSIFIVIIFFNWLNFLVNLFLNVEFLVIPNMYLILFVYIFIYKKTLLQLNLLILLRTNLVIKYYNLTKKMYPKNQMVAFFFFISILYLLKFILIYYQYKIIVYMYYSLIFYLDFVSLFLLTYESLFNPEIPILLYEYLDILLSINKENKNFDKIKLKISYLLSNF